MNRFLVCVSFALPFLLAVTLLAPSANANGRHGHHHRHGRRAVATAPATQTVAVNGQEQPMVPALGTTRLLRRPGEVLTDVLARLTDVACDESRSAIAVDGRVVLCVDHGETNAATAAVEQLVELRAELEHQATMGSETADAITLAIALVDTVIAAREHHHHGQHRNLFASRR